MTTRALTIEAPTVFTRVPRPEEVLIYDMELLTPMFGGGAKSWQPDQYNRIRTQSIKGQLRFWWRTMQYCNDRATLKQQEDALWGSTAQASTVHLAVSLSGEWDTKFLSLDDVSNKHGDFPPYVIFPLQGNQQEAPFTVVTGQKFTLTIHCRNEDREAVEATIKLWVLFGGIGARTRRGCGSIYCLKIMAEFSSAEEIRQFIQEFQCTGENAKAFSSALYPQLQNCRFAWDTVQGKGDATAAWKKFLDAYRDFRQGDGSAREPSNPPGKKYPGPTRWPEADAIRVITGKKPGIHTSGIPHPAGKWFPRAAFGLPILTEFKKDRQEPTGKLTLSPAGKDQSRWPSPVILKIIKLANGDLLKCCLILNHQIPTSIKLEGPDLAGAYILAPKEMPLSTGGKTMPPNAPLPSATSPYDAIIEFLKLKLKET